MIPGLLEPEEGPRETAMLVPGATDEPKTPPVTVKFLQPEARARSKLEVSLVKASGGIA